MRNYSFDTLKLICAIFVIFIHTPQPEIWGNYITPLIRCAVPMFFMISGYFTYGKKDITQSIHKRITQLLTIFSIVFLFYFSLALIANGKESLGHLSILLSYKFILLNSVPYSMHLWYIAAYIYVLYIILLVDRFNLYNWLFFITPILLIASLTIGKYSEIILGHCFPTNYTRNFLFTGLPFFALGMIVKKAKQLPNLYITIILCTVFYIWGIIEVLNVKSLGDIYASTIFLSLSILILFINIKQVKDNAFSKAGRENSLYIYLLHFLIATNITQFGSKFTNLPYFSSLITLLLTLLLIYIFRKLKIIGKII
ncbi:MAG: acyltransferase family protein [Bacteroidaceae bacterium]|nr:acyltransferase family protein [Bacteroidaceae bacterium]